MKKFLVASAGLFCAMLITAHADDTTSTNTPPSAPKHHLTAEQKALKKEMLEKYDTNKDGKLEKSELEQVSAADKEKMEKAGIWPHHHKKQAEAGSDSSTNSPAK